eukprot:TRINITY_DN107211_c0_g1_i1.p1 TRINITY_DN107211_c0_g1~~TRINITY_DN107211_c0_g1_i1.p1  ORF type:complete len:162 (+),score=6.05 TRINITY_DN107211_c0_g1_i1:461-946(+)
MKSVYVLKRFYDPTKKEQAKTAEKKLPKPKVAAPPAVTKPKEIPSKPLIDIGDFQDLLENSKPSAPSTVNDIKLSEKANTEVTLEQLQALIAQNIAEVFTMYSTSNSSVRSIPQAHKSTCKQHKKQQQQIIFLKKPQLLQQAKSLCKICQTRLSFKQCIRV